MFINRYDLSTMESSFINRCTDSLPQKALIFLLCFGRLDGVLYETDFFFIVLIVLSFIGLIFNLLLCRNILKSIYFKWQNSLILYFALSLLWAFDPVQGKIILIAYIGRAIIMLYIFSYLMRTSNIVYLCKSYIVATLLTILHLFAVFGFSGMIMIRAEAIEITQGWNANALGLMVVTAIFMMFFILYDFKKIKRKKSLFFLSLFFVFFILMTGSKTCFFVLFATFALTCFFNSKQKVLSLISITIGIVVSYYSILNVPFLYNIIGERIESLILGFSSLDSEERTVSDNTRFLMLIFGWEKFLEKPWFGYGIGNYQALFGLINNGKRMYAHNNFIEFLVNCGIAGSFIYYWLYGYIIKKAINFNNRHISIACVSFILVLLVSEFGQVTYLVFSNQILLCIFIYIISVDNPNKLYGSKF